MYFFFFKQKTAYGWRISDWSSDVCSSDLLEGDVGDDGAARGDGHGLHVLGHRTQAAEVVDAVEDLTDHVEARGLVWAADAEVETHRLADLGLERLVRGEAADLAVEDVEIGRAACRERGWQEVGITV